MALRMEEVLLSAVCVWTEQGKLSGKLTWVYAILHL